MKNERLKVPPPPQVKENEIVEALRERSRTIVDMELLYPTGFFGPHKFGPYLHLLKRKDSSENDEMPWQGMLFMPPLTSQTLLSF